MTEYRSARGKKNQQQLFMVIIFAILLVLFFVTVGFKLLINTSLFIANITSGSKNAGQTQSEDFVLAPELLSLPDATSSAQLEIHGTATDRSELSLIVNGDNQKQLTVDGDTFDETIRLQKGNNEIILEMRIPKQNIFKKSVIYSVLYQDSKPNVAIDSPADGSRTNQTDITVSGTTDADVSIRVNGFPTTVNADGKFNAPVRLHDGENTIIVTATNLAGTVETKELKVIFESN